MGLLPDTQNCRLCMRRECRERFPHFSGLAIPACITARARRMCRDACRRFPLNSVAGKTFPAFPTHAQHAIVRIWQEAHGPARWTLYSHSQPAISPWIRLYSKTKTGKQGKRKDSNYHPNITRYLCGIYDSDDTDFYINVMGYFGVFLTLISYTASMTWCSRNDRN